MVVRDVITGDTLFYEDAEEFRTVAKWSFDDSVHEAIDGLADAIRDGGCLQPWETYLAIEVLEA